MKSVKIDDLQKGDLIIVRWCDASEMRAKVEQHNHQPDVYVKDWGIFLGISGGRRRHIIVGKDVVEQWSEWGATRIPIDLIESITLVMDRDQLVRVLSEIQALVRRVRLRKYKRVEVC